MTGWTIHRKPKEGLQLYLGSHDCTTVTAQTDGKITLYTITAFLDRTTCERLKKAIVQAERSYWKKKRRARK